MSVGTRLRARLSTTPYRFQVQGVRFIERNGGRALLCDDMGLGKTLQSLGWAALHPEARPMVCVVPATLKYNWQQELLEHAGMESEVLHGQTPYEIDSEILIINYEIMTHWVDALIDMDVSLMIMDECHYVMNKTAKRTKACRKLAKNCDHVIALSGTPITNRPVEFFAILQMVAPHLFPKFWDFAFKYCNPKKGWGGRWDFNGASNLEELHEHLNGIMLRRLKKNVLKYLPVKQRTVIPVDIDNRSEYKHAKEEFIDWLAETGGAEAVKKAKGALALVQLGTLLRIAAAGKMKVAVAWIKDFLAGADKKLVVFAIHTSILATLQKAFPSAAVITGKTPVKKRMGEIKKFQRPNSKCRLFLGQLKAAGVGTTLTAASDTLMLEFGWNESQLRQAEDRTNRIGQTAQSLNVYYLVARDTIEEWLLKVIKEKQIVVDQVLEGKATDARFSLLSQLESI